MRRPARPAPRRRAAVALARAAAFAVSAAAGVALGYFGPSRLPPDVAAPLLEIAGGGAFETAALDVDVLPELDALPTAPLTAPPAAPPSR